MKLLTCLAIATMTAVAPARAQTTITNQQPVSGGGVSRWSQLWQDPGPNGNDLDGDSVCWEDFTLAAPATIDHMEWWGTGACELGFRVEFWRQDPNTIAYQPIGVFYYGGDHTVRPTARFDTNVMTVTPGPGGINHYSYDLAAPVSLAANDAGNVRWFVAIIGLTHQAYYTWNWAQGTGNSTQSYQFVRGLGFRHLGDGRALLLRAAGGAVVTIDANVTPTGSGTITGAGTYPQGSTATLTANSNAGYGFVNWTESNVQVSTSATYSFLANANRTLVAHFTPAYTITSTAMPSIGGVTTGDGVYNSGSTVTVIATPSPSYAFVDWTEFGTTVSTSPTYTFAAASDRALTANFAVNGVLFDFDNAPVHASLPVDVTAGGVIAHLSATAAGFSIQPANTLGFTPAGFGGLCIYPNSVFPADLIVGLNKTATAFSIMYSPQELGCDTSATMRATAYRGTTQVATATATAPAPGTWPTGTLFLASAQPFDSIVVHHDARPPTCQDWGPIFLADNMIITPTPQCVADVDDGTGTGTPDGGVTIDDLLFYLGLFNAGDVRADIDDGSGTNHPDGGVTIDDLLYYLARFSAGC